MIEEDIATALADGRPMNIEEHFFVTAFIRRYQRDAMFKSSFFWLFFRMIKTKSAFNVIRRSGEAIRPRD